ncbi:hypothetical protein Ade02nite_28490 [Paractinoplanes deccanensis]|uniref:Uncharacterized protein n=1 Tax=Paractinoplanes deccanensis TaxID=113561 RepID=A0ABQ3Y2K9_9ACTN|nr:hypothetical protein [Actinoplanes deccanensis]GID74208.1 hypothetical protein Ade02nite_28490 [Actinoplanes deccanensis]
MTQEQTEPSAAEQTRRWGRQFGVTAGLLVGFAALVVAMIWIADGDDVVWQRRVYVFGAVEALVFTAIGWLFGREVHRSAAQSAQASADAANQAADQARSEAQAEAAQASEARVAAAETDAKLQAVRAAALSSAPASRGGPQDVSARSRSEAALDLRAFITELTEPPERNR